MLYVEAKREIGTAEAGWMDRIYGQSAGEAAG